MANSIRLGGKAITLGSFIDTFHRLCNRNNAVKCLKYNVVQIDSPQSNNLQKERSFRNLTQFKRVPATAVEH